MRSVECHFDFLCIDTCCVSLMIKKSMLRRFGHAERKDDNDWVKRCITWEVEGIRQRGRPKKDLVGLC